ncbi:hypothetical protein J2741_001698 [Methanolinea mesophila]|uniref:hypothetical protein n=1 Tax=Methanolinea mesophila TaxID=547055 RepID=UPI001AE80C03|nr:hypothetical protein [Methanolinea mesophila]MBP1929151.1 hypothetical protein [Methanolinea mesophila]
MKLIPVSDEQLLLERGVGLEWELDRARRDIARLEKERTEIIEHCIRHGIFEADEYALISRCSPDGNTREHYFIRREERQDGGPGGV